MCRLEAARSGGARVRDRRAERLAAGETLEARAIETAGAPTTCRDMSETLKPALHGATDKRIGGLRFNLP